MCASHPGFRRTYIFKKGIYNGNIEEAVKNLSSGGGGGDALIVNATVNDNDETVLDKTWQEIYDAFSNNTLVVIKMLYQLDSSEYSTFLINVAVVGNHNGSYYVNTHAFKTAVLENIFGYSFTAGDPDAYPVYAD